MKKIVLATMLLLPISYIQAGESIRWDNASINYQNLNQGKPDFKGLGVAATKLLNENVYIQGSYSWLFYDTKIPEIDDIEINIFKIGLGYRHNISSKSDIFGNVLYQKFDIDAVVEDCCDENEERSYSTGYVTEFGIRSMLNKSIELSGSLLYSKFEEGSSAGLNLSTMYHFTNKLSASISYEKYDDFDSLSLSAHMFF